MSSRRRATRSQAQSSPSASQDPEFEPEEQGPSTYPSRILDRPVIAPAVSRSEGASSTGPAPSQKRKLTIPNCSICKTPPKEPHAVYCCGAMYCHTCLVRAMSEAAKAGCQAECASCGKPMGDPPKKRRLLTSAAQATSALKQLRTEPTGIAGPVSVLPGPPIPGWSFSTAAETNSNILPFGHMSKPDNWIPSSRAEPLRIQHPSLPLSSGPNSMPSMSQLPSIEKYPIRSHEFAHSVATNPSEGSDRPPPGMYRPGGRMTEASGRNAQNQRIMAVIGDVDEMLPKLPDPYAAEEAKRIETQKKTELKIKQELQESQIVKGPSCATCWESSTDPVSMLCCSGIFCKLCLHNSLRYRKRCPLCNANFSHSATIANVSKLLIVQPRAKPVPQLTPLNGDFNVDLLTRNFDYLDEIHLSTMISRLQEIRERKYKTARQESLRTISVGLNDMVKKNKYDMEMLAAKTKAAIQDKQFLDGGFTRESALYGGVTSVMSSSSSSGSSIPTTEETILTPAQITKDERLRAHFDAFTNAYHEIYQKYSPYTNEDQTTMSLNRINAMSEVTEGITRYGNVTKIANLNYDCEPNPSMSIISSLEFDSTGERFVVAGVTKKIKIFDFNYFLNNPEKNHFPLGQLVCRSKISNISWSPDTRSLLASSDYDGHVSAWDIEKGKIVRTFQEHEKRCWTVHFSTVDPKIMASGSDDSKVLIWNVNCDRSVAKIEAKVNVCCVYFSPEKEHQLVFGSADHCVHLYDIRYTGKPLSIFKGHRKAVSYVRYLNKDTVVSASTDSSLRVWNVNDGRCTKVLKGHVNEKNFVGLSSNGDHVMCGSENSRAFFYYKGLSDPLCTYTVGKDNAPEDDTEGFVSSVCWKKDSDHVLVANSLGKVHLLELS